MPGTDSAGVFGVFLRWGEPGGGPPSATRGTTPPSAERRDRRHWQIRGFDAVIEEQIGGRDCNVDVSIPPDRRLTILVPFDPPAVSCDAIAKSTTTAIIDHISRSG
ncbi:MAG: hypothetical protein ACRDQB_10825 [Thermocrispum sp.]